MPLTSGERKERMPYGMQKEIAVRLSAELAALGMTVSETYVSLVMSGEIRPKTKRAKLKLRRTQVAIARAIGLSVDETFSPEEVGYAMAA